MRALLVRHDLEHCRVPLDVEERRMALSPNLQTINQASWGHALSAISIAAGRSVYRA